MCGMSQGYIVNKKVCKKDKRQLFSYFETAMAIEMVRNGFVLGMKNLINIGKTAIHVDHEAKSISQVFQPFCKKYSANENAAWGNV